MDNEHTLARHPGCQVGTCPHAADCAVHNDPAMPAGPCDCGVQPAPCAGDQTLIAFEVWWLRHGQFCRAGGGDYEKTFAWRAWEAALQIQPTPSKQPEPVAWMKPARFGGITLSRDISLEQWKSGEWIALYAASQLAPTA